MKIEAQQTAALAAQQRPHTERLEQACADFEAIFVKQLLDTAQPAPSGDGLFGSDSASRVVQEMHSGYLSKAIGRAQGLGIADLMLRQLSSR